MPARLCQELVGMARGWQGWLALRQKNYSEAVRNFDAAPAPAWSAWAAGRRAFDQRNYSQAADFYQKAVSAWLPAEKSPTNSIPRGLEPRPDLMQAYTDLGGAQLLAGNARAAIGALDESLRRKPSNPWPLFLRGRAKDAAGQTDGALADYSLASRAAFASEGGNPTADGHFYRGVWLYRRKEFGQAEDEFAGGLGLPVGLVSRADIAAWRRLTAVAAGACGASRENLEKSFGELSPYFPKEEARTAIAACAPSLTSELHK